MSGKSVWCVLLSLFGHGKAAVERPERLFTRFFAQRKCMKNRTSSGNSDIFPDEVLCSDGRAWNLLSRKSYEDAEREVLAIGVAEDEFAEVEGLVGVLEAEGLLYYGLSEDCGIAV